MFLSESLRKNTKVILWITMFAFVGFIFLIWGMDVQQSSGRNPAVVAKVNGQNVPTSYYRELLRQAYDQERKQSGDRLSEAQETRLRQSTWDRAVTEILLQQEIKKRNLGVTDEEVAYYIRNSPPAEVAQNPAFLTDGKFDPEKYRQILTNPAYDLSGLEELVRSSVPMRKLEELVASSAKVSDNEVRQVFEQTNQKLDYSYVLARPQAFPVPPDSIPEQELRAYYDKNTDEFRVPETAKLRYVIVEKKPSAKDESDVLTSANDIWRDLRAGTDFAELAATFSEGPEAGRGGDVGTFVPRIGMTTEFEKVAFSLKVGEISSPFKDIKGFHIIRVEEKKTEDGVEKVRYRQILLTVSPGSETLADIHGRVQELVGKASQTSLEQAAQEMGLESRETAFFTKDGMAPILPQDATVREFPFKHKVGEVGKPVETQRGWVVFQVAEKRPATLPTFQEALQSVKAAVVRARQEELAGRKIDTVAAAVSRGA
ncbi:MAG: SurA N-terminal domain-containing protein, partial [Candidatus Eisenbacteria bacterium]|nr:SurA N-terminal domain-containing protein [Candidatus Eisenbacteria bacterium]